MKNVLVCVQMYQLIITFVQSTELHGTLGLKINDWLIELKLCSDDWVNKNLAYQGYTSFNDDCMIGFFSNGLGCKMNL